MKTKSQDRGSECVYEIDSDDKIVYCNEEWDSFAIENNGVDVRFEDVKGRTLWHFVSDPSTTDLYQRLIAHVRGGNSVRFNLRCDSPTMFRVLEMEISTTMPGRVRFATRMIRVEPLRCQTPAISESGVPDMPLMVCSWCGRLKIGSQTWANIVTVVAKEKLFERENLPPISHGICDKCLEDIGGPLGSGL